MHISDPTVSCAGPQMTLTSHSFQACYSQLAVLGAGAFGIVVKARKKATGNLVAVKTLRHRVDPRKLAEVQFYQDMARHPNIVRLKEMFFDTTTARTHFVMELMQFSALDMIIARKGVPLSVDQIANICSQVLRGLAHIHTQGYVHRDLKPENILLCSVPTKQGPQIQVKVADFGLSRRVNTGDERSSWTTYVATRWYRAPELLLGHPIHTCAVDMWSFGLLLYELCLFSPLFPGKNTCDMILLQLHVLGTPSQRAPGGSWYEAARWPLLFDIFAVEIPGRLPCEYLPRKYIGPFSDCIVACLQWNPSRRANAAEVLAVLAQARRAGDTHNRFPRTPQYTRSAYW